MIAVDERIWLHNPETGGHFHCPADAAAAWKARGWRESASPPPEQDNTKDEAMRAAAHEALAEEESAARAAHAAVLENEKAATAANARTSRTPSGAATKEEE